MLFGVQFMRLKKKVHKHNDSSLFTKHPIPGHSQASNTPYPVDLIFLNFLCASLHFWAIFLGGFSLFLPPLFLLSSQISEWHTLLNERERKTSAVHRLQQLFSKQWAQETVKKTLPSNSYWENLKHLMIRAQLFALTLGSLFAFLAL